MNRVFVLVLVVAAMVMSSVALTSPPAIAQQVVCDDDGCYRVVGGPSGDLCTVAEFALSGNLCVQLNPFTTPAEQRTFTCATGPPGVAVTQISATVDGIRYITRCTYPVPTGPVTCPAEAKKVEGECRVPVGRIKVRYTVECVGEGLARVDLGEPELTDNGGISLITVNGSATVGADIPGGAAVAVVVTPNNSGHIVDVAGPDTAPPCASETPTAAPTAVPTTAPAATAVPAAPAATATPAPAAEPTATVTNTDAADSTDQDTTDSDSTDSDSDDSDSDAAEDDALGSNASDDGTPAVAAIPAVATIDSAAAGECGATGSVALQLSSSVSPVDVADQVQWFIDGTPLGAPAVPGAYTSMVVGDGTSHVITLRSLTRTDVADANQNLFLPDCLTQTATPVPTAITPLVASQDGDAGLDGLAETDGGSPIVPIALILGVVAALAGAAYALTNRDRGY